MDSVSAGTYALLSKAKYPSVMSSAAKNFSTAIPEGCRSRFLCPEKLIGLAQEQ
jgi:hypothetical protein